MSDLQSKMRAASERAFPPSDEVIAARLQSEQDQNPDEAAAALADAEVLGLDPETAVKNRVVLRHRMERERKREEAARLAASRTTLAQMIEEGGGFAALVHDDLDNLSAVEKGANLFRSAAAGLTQLPGSVLGGIEAIGQNVRQRGLNREAAEFLGPLGLTPEESRQFADRARRSIVGQGADISKGAADFLRPDRQGFVGQVSEGLGQVAGQGALFVATGGGSTATLLLQGVDQQAERIGDENIDPNRELLALGFGGAATAVSERIGLGRIFRGAPGTELLRRNLLREVGESALAEGASEALEGVLQNAIERGLYNPEADIIDVGDTANDAAVGAAVGAVMRGLVMASLPGRARIEQAESDAQALGDVMDAASSTRLMGRRRQSLEDFLGRITEGQQVYLPAQQAIELFQSAGEQDVAAALGVEESALGDALLEGGDVAVSAAKVITLADRPYAEGIKEIVRLRPDGLNLREAQSEELQDEIRREFDELVASGREEFTSLNAIQEIEQSVADQLIASGEKPDIAQTQAAVWGAAFETLQGRYGIDPTETFERLGLRIEGPEQARPRPQIDELDLLLDRLRAGERNQPDAPSFLDFARERGVRVTEGVEGELRAIAENAPRRPGLRGIIQDDGVPVDELGELAADAGYFEVRPDLSEVLDALDSEARGGSALYPADSNAIEALAQNDLLDQIEDELTAAGVDLREVDNETARAALNEGVLSQSGDQPRASVTLELGNALGDREVLVRLGEASDVTSFLHESAHVFLEIYRGLAADNSELSAELDTITEALGVEPGGAIEREHHERFAEQFEAFLAEGKAPSKGLDAAFQRFRAWFTRVYDRLRGKLPKLPPEARDFFSRMLATDGQTEEAQRSNGFRLSELMEGLMTPDQIERYRKAGGQARQLAEDNLRQEAFKEFSAAERRRVKKARDELRPQIEAEVMARPVNRAFHLLTSGELPGTQETPEFLKGRRLSREAVVALRGEVFLKRVVKNGARALYTTKKGEVGADPEAVAMAAGFPSGDALLLALANTKTPREQVSEEIEQTIRERFGDYEADGTLERDAADAVMNDYQAKVFMAEQAALAKKALGGGMSLAEIKAVAAELIELRPMSRAIQPKQYLRVMRNKGVEAIREASKENWFAALKAKQQQLLNHELARLAVDAARERTLIQQEVKHKQNPKKLSARDYPPAFIDAMQMLANLPGSEDQASARRAINAAVSKISEEFGVSPILPTALTAEQDVPRLSDMTLAQARELRASLRGLVKLGRAEGRAALEKRKALRAQAADVIRSNRNERGGAVFQSGGQERGGVARRTLEEVHWSNRRLDFITQRFDGGADGFFTEQIWQPLSKAADEEGRRNERDQDWWEALLKDHGVTPVEVARHVDEPALFGGQQVPFGALLEMAQHLGSQSNLDRLLADPRWAKVGTRPDLEAIMEVLNRRLEARHWALVQARWDHLESKWPEIAALEERVSGVAPEKVIARAIETSAGVLRGGYYPLSYEGGVQSAASQDIAAGLANPPSTATTRHGFTQSRVKNVSRPLALAFGGDLLHHAEVNHDLTHREPIKEIAALFAGDASNNPLVAAINETYGKSALDAVTTILRRVGTGPEMATDVLSQVTRFLRRNYATSLLAGSVRTALLQLPGLAVAIQHSGRRTFARGFLSTWKNPAEAIRVMRAKSSFMDGRLHTRQNDQRVRIEGEPFERYLNSSTLTARSKSAFRKVNETLYLPMAWLEASVVSAPLWHGVYSQELEAGTEESLAISRADRAVSQTAGSGRLMDRTTWQTSGNELLRSLTFLGGYSIAMYNQATNTVVRPDRPLPRRAVDFLGFVFAAAIFPGLFEHLLLSPDDGDDEDNLQDLLVDSIFWQQIVPMLPLGGVVNSTRYGGGSQRVDVALQDASRAGGELWDVAEAAFDPSADVGEEALDFLADGLPPIMMLTGLGGAAQVNRTLDTIVKDDDPTLEEAIITGPDRQ